MFSTTTSLLDEAIELFDKVDSLLEGSSADHEIAFGLLAGYESEVVIFAWLIAKFLQIINCFFFVFFHFQCSLSTMLNSCGALPSLVEWQLKHHVIQIGKRS